MLYVALAEAMVRLSNLTLAIDPQSMTKVKALVA